jgi:hypothetical protein
MWFSCDILLLNCGLHDIKKKKGSEVFQIHQDEYKSNCEAIIQISKQISKKVYWITTTHFDEKRHNSLNTEHNRFEYDNELYNSIALDLMKKQNIEIIDLRTFTTSLWNNIREDHVHFIDEIKEEQAKFIFASLSTSYDN